jgi:hypothetical protein
MTAESRNDLTRKTSTAGQWPVKRVGCPGISTVYTTTRNSPFLGNSSVNMHSRDNTSLSTLVAVGLIRVLVTTDETDDYNRRTVQWGVLFPVRTKLQKGVHSAVQSVSRVEARSNTSTVTLRVVEGDEKKVSNLRQ